MINFIPTLVKNLNTLGYPVVNEFKIKEEVQKPCITYIESNNATIRKGSNGLEYSDLLYTIKVWEDDLSKLIPITSSLDEIMSGLGFTREFAMDFQDYKLLRYRGIGVEQFSSIV